jgi:galactokinase
VDLAARLAHFIAEDARVPRALAAIAAADEAGLRALSRGTQHDADALLRNQIPETNALAALAHDAGALAASSFGAGFGGSVWAMVHADDAAAVVQRWQAMYLEQHAPPKPVTAFIARPAPAAGELFLSE